MTFISKGKEDLLLKKKKKSERFFFCLFFFFKFYFKLYALLCFLGIFNLCLCSFVIFRDLCLYGIFYSSINIGIREKTLK